jgi:hypothetical protein
MAAIFAVDLARDKRATATATAKNRGHGRSHQTHRKRLIL